MEVLSLYIPGVMGLAFALLSYFAVRHISEHRLQLEESTSTEETALFASPTSVEPLGAMELATVAAEHGTVIVGKAKRAPRIYRMTTSLGKVEGAPPRVKTKQP